MTTPTLAQVIADAEAVGSVVAPMLGPQAAGAYTLGVTALNLVQSAMASGTNELSAADQSTLAAALAKLTTDLNQLGLDIAAQGGGAASA